MKNTDTSIQLQQQVQHACEQSRALRIVAGNSKAFYGCLDTRPASADILDLSKHQGVLHYEPTELVITARAGTPLSIIEELLDDNGQMLPFEPPGFADTATIGGTIACNLSGPRRAYAGAARDFLLGCKMINGKGEIMSFGGEVMKNVAGYDVSRLMAGAMGTLGVLLEVSLKVLPKAEKESSRQFQCPWLEALEMMHRWSQSPLPVSATSYHDSTLHVRLSGADKAVDAAIIVIGGDKLDDDSQYWSRLKEQQLAFFQSDRPLWRVSLASDIKTFDDEIAGETDTLVEWGGALRWLISDAKPEKVHQAASHVEGHATLFRHAHDSTQTPVFQPLPPGLQRINQNLKQAFDPNDILNPGKLYPRL